MVPLEPQKKGLKVKILKVEFRGMTNRVIPAAVNWAQLLKQTAPADKKLMAAFKVKKSREFYLFFNYLFFDATLGC